MAHAIDDMSNAAADLAKMVLEGGVQLHPPVITEAILGGSEEIIGKIYVSADSILVGRTLEELDLATNTGVWIVAVRRGGKRWIFNPDGGDFKIFPGGDVLIGRGGTDTSINYLKEIARGGNIKVMGDGRA